MPKKVLTLIPIASETCWSSAMARSAIPYRLLMKNHPTAANPMPEHTAATSSTRFNSSSPMKTG